jgi:hypothetical protein
MRTASEKQNSPQSFDVQCEIALRHEDDAIGRRLVDRRYFLLQRFAFYQQHVEIVAQPRVRFWHERAAQKTKKTIIALIMAST